MKKTLTLVTAFLVSLFLFTPNTKAAESCTSVTLNNSWSDSYDTSWGCNGNGWPYCQSNWSSNGSELFVTRGNQLWPYGPAFGATSKVINVGGIQPSANYKIRVEMAVRSITEMRNSFFPSYPLPNRYETGVWYKLPSTGGTGASNLDDPGGGFNVVKIFKRNDTSVCTNWGYGDGQWDNNNSWTTYETPTFTTGGGDTMVAIGVKNVEASDGCNGETYMVPDTSIRNLQVCRQIPDGTLTVSTTPVSGAIYVDGVYRGSGSWSGTLPPGTYTVSFGAVAGYNTPPNQSAPVSPGAPTSITGTYIPVCTNSYPATPSISETVSSLTANLSWSLGSWGTNCVGNVDQYIVYVDGTLVNTQSTTNLFGLYSYAGTAGTHLWYVVATNGALSKASNTRQFTLCANTPPAFTSSSESTSNLTANLTWTLSGWGANCAGNTNQYQIYVDSSLASTQTTPILTSLYSYTGVAGSHSWYVVANNGSSTATTSPRTFTLVTPASSWFQVVGGDVVAATGNITISDLGGVPTGEQFLLTPDSAMIYQGTTTGITDAQVDGWRVNTAISTSVITDNSYDKFRARISNRVVPKTSFDLSNLSSDTYCPTPETDGACYFISSSSTEITLPGQTISKKIVLLVDGTSGNIKIGGDIDIGSGGLLVVLAKNNITLDGTIAKLQGVYLAQGSFDTGLSSNRLEVTGTVVGLGNVALRRTYANNNIPAEMFVYNPGYISALPTTLFEQKRQSEELAP